MFKRICQYYRIIIPLLTLVSLTLVYFGGLFSPQTDLEKISSYASQVVLNNTKNKERICITAERKSKAGSLPDPETEFRNLYGVFAQRSITFSSVINPDKAHQITIGNNLSKNLSAMYVGPVGSMEYNGGYRHYIYPLELMFPDDKDYEKKTTTRNYAYISQSQADLILETILHEEKTNNTYSAESYKKLILNEYPFAVDGKLFDFGILNIYFERNYYYEGLSDAVGDFILTSYSFPNDLRKEQKNLYFLNSNDYQNKYFMEYLNEVYSTDDYILKLNPFNLVGDYNADFLMSFHNLDSNYSLEWLSTLLFIVAAAMLFVNVLLYGYCVLLQKKKHKSDLIIFLPVVFIPYLIFTIIYFITKNSAFISDISSKNNAIYICVYAFLMILIYFSDASFIAKRKSSVNSQRKESYEFDI